MSRLYTPEGYPNISYLDERGLPFNVLTGGRGIGKTYSILKYYLERDESVVYLRRTREQSEIAGTQEYTPYKSVCDDALIEFGIIGGKVKTLVRLPGGKPVAYFLGLSSIANVRGFDLSDCRAIVYDEFIPEQQARPIRNEGHALLNAYETVNRNRELSGGDPVKLWLLSNTNDIMSPILKELGLLKIALTMERKGLEEYVDRERGLQYINFCRSPISERKAKTALYKLAGSSYTEMAIKNSYGFDGNLCVSRNLNEYKPIASLGEITFYRHKSKRLYYATTHRSGNPPAYGTGEKEVARFLSAHGALYNAYALGYMEFESLDIQYIVSALLR